MRQLKNVHLLKYGIIPLPDGENLNVNDELLNDLVNTYNPEESHEAPAILGHDSDTLRFKLKHDGSPSFGWLKKVYKKAKGLYGDFDISEELAKWIEDKKYKKLSISFYPENSKMSPVPGKAYIRHVAFLGSEPPVVKGLEPYSLSENDTKFVEIMNENELETSQEFSTEEAENWLRALLAEGDKGYKDDIVSFEPRPSEENSYLADPEAGTISGTFMNEQGIVFSFEISKGLDGYTRTFSPLNPEEAENLQNEANGIGSTPEEVANEMAENIPDEELGMEGNEPMEDLEKTLISEEEKQEMENMRLSEELESYKKDLSELRECLSEMKAMKDELSMTKEKLALAEKMALLSEYKNFSEGLIYSGKIISSEIKSDEIAEFMLSLKESNTVCLSEGNQVNSLEWFKSFLSKLPKAVELSEIASSKINQQITPKGLTYFADNVTNDSDSSELHTKVVSLCESRGTDYKNQKIYIQTLKEVINNA